MEAGAGAYCRLDGAENPLIDREELLAAALELGFQRAGIAPAAGGGEGGELVCALSCFRREPDDPSTPGDPYGLIAPFARRHYYRDAVRRLRRLAAWIRRQAGGRPAGRDPPLWSNSARPEKRLAVAAGLGFYGRHSLVIAPGLGSLFIIAGMTLPAGLVAGLPPPGEPAAVRSAPGLPAPERPPREWAEPGAACRSCRACREACPTGALQTPGRPDPARCLQAAAARPVELPAALREAWGARLYGCQACQEVCPWNRGLERESACGVGELGPGLPLREVLGKGPEELRRRLRGSALGRSWIAPEALLRNALLAAGHRGDPAVRPQVEAYRRRPQPLLAAAARWALERLG